MNLTLFFAKLLACNAPVGAYAQVLGSDAYGDAKMRSRATARMRILTTFAPSTDAFALRRLVRTPPDHRDAVVASEIAIYRSQFGCVASGFGD